MAPHKSRSRRCSPYADGAGVSTSAVTLTLTAGSVLVSAEIFVASEAAAATASSDLSTGVLKDASSLKTALTTQYTSDGLDATSLAVEEITTAPAAVSIEPDEEEEESSVPITAVLGVAAALCIGVAIACWFVHVYRPNRKIKAAKLTKLTLDPEKPAPATGTAHGDVVA